MDHTIQSAFDKDPALGDRVLQSAKQSRDQWQLLLDIATYIHTHHLVEPAAKKRKLPANGSHSQLAGDVTLAGDVSLSIPVRKKLAVSVHSGPEGGLTIALPDNEAQVPWSAIEFAFCLPVPDKAARASYFVLILRGDAAVEGQFVWTCPDRVAGKESDGDAEAWSAALSEGTRLVRPVSEEFASAVVQAHRKGEAAYHVKAHVGSKEGYLFFLENGIVFGFKKPILFYPFGNIQSISYTSVLQRTFNLVITALDGAADIEFSMLDQVDFAGIDEYIKRHGLNDASMAAERQAKKYHVNKKEEANGDGETELAKAEAQIQDEEDEEEEDYDPGSEGESEGEGSSDEEDHDAQNDDGQEDDAQDEAQ